jgi:hypothetical protein
MLLEHHRAPVSAFLLRSHEPFNLCLDLCPDSMHAYIFGKVVTTTDFCIFSVVSTTAPHWRFLVSIIYRLVVIHFIESLQYVYF